MGFDRMNLVMPFMAGMNMGIGEAMSGAEEGWHQGLMAIIGLRLACEPLYAER